MNTVQTILQSKAAYVLSDEITNAALYLERAELVMQDVNEEYFNKYDPDSKDGLFAIAYEYHRYTVKSDIVTDYLYKIREILQKLAEQANEGSKMKQAELQLEKQEPPAERQLQPTA